MMLFFEFFAPAFNAASQPRCASASEQHFDQHALLVARTQEATLHLVEDKVNGLSTDFCVIVLIQVKAAHA